MSKLHLSAYRTRIDSAKMRLDLAKEIGDSDKIKAATLEYMSALEAPRPVMPAACALDRELSHSAVPTSSAASM